MKVIIFAVLVLHIITEFASSQSITIVSGPQDTTVCVSAVAEMDCGYTGADPHTVPPTWRIIFLSDNGSVIRNDTCDGFTINNNDKNGLQWVPDLTSGDLNAPNSKLLVGPVNKTHNQSSYQCSIETLNHSVMSSVGTLTVVGPPSVMINVDEICTTSITISLNTYSHPTCGDVSHNVTISGNIIYPDTINGSKYTIDNLQSDTLYNITVTSTYNSGSRTFSNSTRTSLPEVPNPVEINSIDIQKARNKVTVTWKAPKIDKCSMLPIKHYDVRINSSKGEVKEANVNEATLIYEDMDKDSKITYTVNITVVDINGQRSNSTVTEKTVRDTTSSIGGSKRSSTSCVATIVIIAMAVLVVGL